MNKCGIYKFTSPSNKIYIGSSTNIDKRITYYKNGNCKKQTKFYNSLLKYGFDNHVFEIIELCEKPMLYEREVYWGEYYNVLNYETGLNLSLPKTLNRTTTDIRKKRTPEQNEKFSKVRKGLRYSEAAKVNMSKGQNNRYKNRKLSCFKNDIFIKSFNLLKDAAKEYNTNSSYIQIVINKENRTAFGLKWKYITPEMEEIYKTIIN